MGHMISATPRLGTASDTETRLTLLHDHLHALCDLGRKRSMALSMLTSVLSMPHSSANKTTLTAALANYGGLYHYRDWAFSALRPLPRAQIPLENGSFILWTSPSGQAAGS